VSEEVRRKLFVVDIFVVLGEFGELGVDPGSHVSLQGGGAGKCITDCAAVE
jgi:hypothetical protein